LAIASVAEPGSSLLSLRREAVAQLFRLRSAVLGVVAAFGGVPALGPVLGPDGREAVSVEFGEVVAAPG
jgi:cytochrome c biogenesis protein CcdA